MAQNWFDPDALAETERLVRASDLNEMSTKGDFGSYAIANRGEGIAASLIESHNLVHTFQRVCQYKALLGRREFFRIADMGSGLGLTTEALGRVYPTANITGFEISGDGVAYAQRKFTNMKFEQMALDPESELGASFDLILCQEFYPFTRTDEWDVHRGYLDMLMRHLQPNGVLLIELSERDRHKTILKNLLELDRRRAVVAYLPFDKIYRNLRIFWLSQILSSVAAALLKRDRNICIMLSGSPPAAAAMIQR